MLFQSSFELTGYITVSGVAVVSGAIGVSKLFRAYRLYNYINWDSINHSPIKFQSSFELTGYITLSTIYCGTEYSKGVSKLFRAYRLYNVLAMVSIVGSTNRFKALSSLQVI